MTFLNHQDHWEIGVINTRNGWGWRLHPCRKRVKAYKAKDYGHGERRRAEGGMRELIAH